MKPTIKMIAERAGVSTATVSNALNHTRGVSPETIDAVRKIADELGYVETGVRRPTGKVRRDIRGIRLITFRKHGLVVSDNPFFSELIHGIEGACSSRGFELVFAQIQAWEKEDCRRLAQLLQEPDMAVILLATEMESEDLALLEDAKSPLLLLDSYFPESNLPTVTINNFEAGLRATQHLLEMGHKDIGIIVSSRSFNNMRYRYLGYREALERNNLSPNDAWVFQLEPSLQGSFRDMSFQLSKNPKLPTALFAANDELAAGAMRALQEKGLSVPEDISLIGMDDLPICLALNPPLSSLHVYRETMAEAAVSSLLSWLDNDFSGHQLLEIGTDLVQRGSVRPKGE